MKNVLTFFNRILQSTSRPGHLRKLLNSIMATTEADASGQSKRPAGAEGEQSQAKKTKTENGEDTPLLPYKKKKAALLMMFCGKNYVGMQRNPDVVTIESCLYDALLKAGAITQEQYDEPNAKMNFQRATRTDKRVSAAGMLCSLKMFSDLDNSLDKINQQLPDDIRILEVMWMTKGFNCKSWADSRTYSYMMPTFAFTHSTHEVKDDYRVTEAVLSKASEVLQLFKGTHNFHNYTSGKKATDSSCKRYIMELSIGKPFERDGMEFVAIHVKGQSFMLHQIRKMIGTMIAIIQELITEEYIELSFGPERLDIPKAPGVGLMLEEIHFHNYNKRFGNDGIHQPIDFAKHKESIEKFKQEYISPVVIEAEKEDKSMMSWIETLREYHFKGQHLNLESNSVQKDSGDKSVKTDSKESSAEMQKSASPDTDTEILDLSMKKV